MKLQCGIIAIILVGIFCFGGGLVVGKLTGPVVVNNISNSESKSIANAIAVSSLINMINERRVDTIEIKIDGITNVNFTTVTNGVTNFK